MKTIAAGTSFASYSRGLAFLVLVGMLAIWPLVIGAALAQMIFWLAGRGDASLAWCVTFALPVAPHFFGRALPDFHRLTRPRP